MAAQWPPRGLKPWDDALKEYVDEIRSDLEPDVTDNTAARHTHANKELLDGIPTGGAWYQTLRRGTAGPEWVDPAGTVVPTLLVPMQGTLDGWDRSGAITGVGVGALRFRDGGALVEEGTTNLFRNPSAVINTATVAAANGDITRDTDGVSVPSSFKSTNTSAGSWYFNVGTSVSSYFPVSDALPCTWSMAVKGSVGATLTLRAFMRDNTGTIIEFDDTTISTSGEWDRISFTRADLPDGTVYASLYLLNNVNPYPTIDSMWMTDGQVEQKAYRTSLVRGDMGPGYAWTGTAHASASTRAETSITIPAASFPASLAIRYSEDMGQTWRLATLDDEGAFGNYGVVTYANGDLTFGVSERNVIIGGVRGDERALTDGEKASLLASPVWTWGGLSAGQQGPYTHPATILGTFPPNAQAAVGGATLRTAPGTTAPTIDTLTEGTEVHDTGQRITESATDYAYVLTAVGQGYVDESDITGL